MFTALFGLASVAAVPATAESFVSWFDAPFAGQSFGDDVYGTAGYPEAWPPRSRSKRARPQQAKLTRVVHRHPVEVDKSGMPIQWSDIAAHLATMQRARPGAIGVFLGDSTLRKGDAVMTDAGLRIFHGHADEKEHSLREFEPLDLAKKLPHRAELYAIQKVSAPPFEVARLASPAGFSGVHHASIEFALSEPKAIRQIPGVQ